MNLQQGFTYRNEKFKADGTPSGYAVVVVDSVESEGDSLLVFFTSKGITSSGSPVKINGTYACCGNNWIIDPMSFADYVEASGHMTVQRSVPIVYPYDLEIGDSLSLWQLYFTITEDWGGQMNFRIDCASRKCVGRDTLTISDIPYDTWLVESYSTVIIKQGPVTMGKMKMQLIEWVSPVYGILRTESYSENKLIRFSKVTEITKGGN